MKYLDKRKRISRSYKGERDDILVSRYRCTNPDCRRIHTELPDCLVPHKHYKSEVIENVIDEVVCADDEAVGDYPCIRTMERWKKWFEDSKFGIEACLRRFLFFFFDYDEEVLKSDLSLLSTIRDNDNGWLSIISRVMYNTGYINRMSGVPPDLT